MINLQDEQLLSFTEAVGHLPSGVSPVQSTWWRWFKQGVSGVKLETVKIGGRRFTSLAALQRFIESTSLDRDRSLPAARSVKQRERGLVRAQAELSRLGI